MSAVARRCLTSTLGRRFGQSLPFRVYSNTAESSKTTHFGFEDVPEDEKQSRVDAVFQNVAEKYDLMNDSMSFGVHRIWKDAFIRRLDPGPGTQLVDVAGGTGDIAFRFLKYTQKARSHRSVTTADQSNTSDNLASHAAQGNSTRVLVCDINESMLNVGKQRAAQLGISDQDIAWQQGNAECLPLADNTFDAYTIAFGIRNCTRVDKVLTEAYRILKPGGRFMCLEFSEVKSPLLRRLYDAYSFQVIPVMGQVIASDWKSYQYLVESIRKFPNQEDFAAMIEEAGFSYVTVENLTFGVAAIHSAFKL